MEVSHPGTNQASSCLDSAACQFAWHVFCVAIWSLWFWWMMVRCVWGLTGSLGGVSMALSDRHSKHTPLTAAQELYTHTHTHTHTRTRTRTRTHTRVHTDPSSALFMWVFLLFNLDLQQGPCDPKHQRSKLK